MQRMRIAAGYQRHCAKSCICVNGRSVPMVMNERDWLATRANDMPYGFSSHTQSRCSNTDEAGCLAGCSGAGREKMGQHGAATGRLSQQQNIAIVRVCFCSRHAPTAPAPSPRQHGALRLASQRLSVRRLRRRLVERIFGQHL